MSARFEVVRTNAAQPWHARFVAANGRIVWTTEQYARRGKAEGAIIALSRAFGFTPVVGLKWNVEGVEKVFVYTDLRDEVVSDMPLVKYVDERVKP